MRAKLHSFGPVADADARVLILGSMPGTESLRRQEYYGHPRNAFWRLMEDLFSCPRALPYPERLARLKAARVALWDTLGACTREGSLDSGIRAERPNDLAGLLKRCPKIRVIFCNGAAAFQFLKKYHVQLFARPDLEIIRLPSTSPAAARYSYAEKLVRWRIVRERAQDGGLNSASILA